MAKAKKGKVGRVAGPAYGIHRRVGMYGARAKDMQELAGVPSPEFDPWTHDLHMQMSPMHKPTVANPHKQMTAATINRTKLFSRFANPYQDLDYRVIEAILTNTPVGPFLDTLIDLVVGKGFRPELVPKFPNIKDPKADKDLVEKRPDIINNLLRVDKAVDRSTPGISMQDKVAGCLGNMWGYNRAALLFGFKKKIKIPKIGSVSGIPNVLIPLHPREMGILEMEDSTRSPKALHVNDSIQPIEMKNMIYMWDPMITAKRDLAWGYGTSLLSPILDGARTLRRITAVDFPAMAQATWSGHAVAVVKPEGQTLSAKQDEYNQVASNIVPGAWNILMEDPKDVNIHSINYDPKVAEFVTLCESLVKHIIAGMRLPYSLMFDEGASNQSTAHQKIALALRMAISPMRERAHRIITPQWYQPIFETVCRAANEEELLEEYEIKLVFENLDVAEWMDKVDALATLMGIAPMKPEAMGELLGIDNLPEKIDEDARQENMDMGMGVPGARGSYKNGSSMKFKASADGDIVKVSQV